MRIVIFGLTISSSWGNGHATLWRGLCRALVGMGHEVTFFERDVAYYAGARDLHEIEGGALILYDDWEAVRPHALRETAEADAAIVTSYCPDAIAAGELVQSASRALCVFYDLDTPITLSQLGRAELVPYIGPRGLTDFDLVLSYTGGAALAELRARLGARRVVPLYGHVDPQVHRPVPPRDIFHADLSYIGTYAADRQDKLETLLLEPARQHRQERFVIAGAQYPEDFPWSDNIHFVRHLPPCEHPAFYSSSRLTLNITRSAMARMGWCPSGRLFEAAACGAAIVSDSWKGLDEFFAPGEEIVVVRDTEDVIAALDMSQDEIRRIAEAARNRVLEQHTSTARARELIAALDAARSDLPAHMTEQVEA